MLERTAGCLESGSLRRLLPVSRKSLKSCRTLHSGFWTHGGGDIELSPFWASLVRAAAPAEPQDEPAAARSLSGHTGVFLDFLYPAGSLNFLRQCSVWGIDRVDSRWSRHCVARINQRQYTSSAKDITPVLDTDASSQLNTPNPRAALSDDGNMEELLRVMKLERSSDFEEAWRQFKLLTVEEQYRLRPQLIVYLSPSRRPLDEGRMLGLFESLGEEQRTSNIYRVVIRSYLKQENLAEAMRLHSVAFEKLRVPTGCEELLAYLFEQASWERAMSLWEKVTNFESRPDHRAYNIYEVLDRKSNLAEQASKLARYIDSRRRTEPNDSETTEKLLKFGSEILRRTLWSTTNFSPSRFTRLLQTLTDWKFDTPTLLGEAMHMLLGLKQNKLALTCYLKARKGGFKFDTHTLEAILAIYCHDHDVPGMKLVMDDFFEIHGGPSQMGYGLCMQEFATKGDSHTVHALWGQFISRHNNDTLKADLAANDFAPVLHVHAVRGELQEVVLWFNKIKSDYGLYPSTICWNILINAYGKAHDFEGAYNCFQDLLSDPHSKPTHYTIGTVMGICSQQGDIDRVIELYRLAQNLGIPTSAAMLDNLVLAHIQDNDMEEAERICEQGLTMKLLGYKTRMWNYLLVAYAQRRDLNNVNRILQRMSEASIKNDAYTYSALMQALCMVKQPDRAYKILKDVLPDAGIKPTNFHYAVIMGGYINNGEPHKAFQVQDRMWQVGLYSSGSSKLLAMKARYEEDGRLLIGGRPEEVFQGALEMFREAMQTMAIEHIVAVPKKGAAQYPIDITYPSMFYSYVMHILASTSDTASVDRLYAEYISIIPESRRDYSPLPIMSALMLAKHREDDHDSVEECWRVSVAQAKIRGQPLPAIATGSDDGLPPLMPHKIVPLHQLDLSKPLNVYLDSLAVQNKIETMITTVNGLLEDGFGLDNRTWNHYIQLLAQKYRYKVAFKLCEERLMDNWTDWQTLRWRAPVRNRLPFDLRNLRKQSNYLRPTHITLLYLARSVLDIQSMAAESRYSEVLLEDIRESCPKVIRAIETMPRTDTELERRILREW